MCSRTTILLSAVILLLSMVACQKAKKADGSKDLMLASMQNTIAELTEVVGQQTKAISEVMIWLSEAKVEFENLQNTMEDNNKMLIANSTKERTELSTKFFEQLAVLNNKLTDSDASIEDLASKLNESKLETEQLRNTLTNVTNETEDLASKLKESKLETEQLRETLTNVTNDVKSETEDLASKLNESKLETEQLRKTLSNAEETIEDLASKELDLASKLSEAKVEFENLQNTMEDNNKMLIANSTKERAELSTKFFEQLTVLNNKLTDSDASMEDLASKLNESKLETEQLRETLANVTNETENLASKLNESKSETEQLRKTLSNAEETIEDLASKEDLASNVNELKNTITTELDEVKTTISNIGSEVEIVSSEEAGGNPKCAKVCTGTTGRTTTSWSGRGIAKTTVTIQGCGFVKVPTVTTSIEGTGGHYMVTGASAVFSVTTSSFTIILKHGENSNTSSYARSNRWNVEWIAVGYTC